MLVLPLQLGLWLSLADRRHHGPQHDTETLTCASSQPRACVRQSGERHLVPRPEQQFWTVFLIESQIIRNRCRQLFVATNGPTSTLYCSYNPISHAGSRRQVAARRATPPLLPVHCWPGSFLELMTRLGYDKFAVQGGDIGAGVAQEIGWLAPNTTACAGEFMQHEFGYIAMQTTRPALICAMAADSPVAQLASLYWFTASAGSAAYVGYAQGEG